ncbi:MAG TPA: tetratricopeptide repeat protein [Planctomycetota bacterium]|nr:tetratricopeptide repeat protein [Planctomycetota bacterium]
MKSRILPALLLPLFMACSSTPDPAPEAEASRHQADVEFLQRRDSAAEREYERLLQSAPSGERGPLLIQLGRCRLGKGDATGAIAAFDEAAASSLPEPMKVEAWYRRGIAQNFLWRPDRALADFRRVLEAPKSAREAAIKTDEFLYRLGVTYLRLGMAAEGRKCLDQIVKDHPESSDAPEARERLALKTMHIQIARAPNEVTAARRVSEARAKGLSAEVLASASAPGGRLVVVGRFSKFEDAVRELERIRGLGYADAFPIP